jgi:predicted glycosyltransferase
VHFTARDRASTCELMDLYGLAYTPVAGEFGRGLVAKATGTLGRAAALARAMRDWRADVSFGHGSRALPIASRLLGVPTVTMYDYEWVNPLIFNLCCRAILMPAAVDTQRCREAGINPGRVRGYPGFKEELYLADRPLDPSLRQELGLQDDLVQVLIRPPATTAHYHNPEAETLLNLLLARLSETPQVQLVWLARGADQKAFLARRTFANLVIPQKVYDGPSLVAAMDLVIGGGGTMTREAAILGIPSYSFFRGRAGRVDETLEREGRLALLRAASDIARKVDVKKKPRPAAAPDNRPLVRFIVEQILAAAKG